MATHNIISKTGQPVPTLDQWLNSLPEGEDKNAVLAIAAQQGEHLLANPSSETPIDAFVAVWQRYLNENNLLHTIS